MSVGYVYLLESETGKKFYIGCTTDIKRRIKEHNQGSSFYTKSRGPWRLIGYETFPSFELAQEYERKLKHTSRMSFFFKKRLLNKRENVSDDPVTSLCAEGALAFQAKER